MNFNKLPNFGELDLAQFKPTSLYKFISQSPKFVFLFEKLLWLDLKRVLKKYAPCDCSFCSEPKVSEL